MLKGLADMLAQQVKQAIDNNAERESLTQNKLKEIIQMALRKCDLVTREEFDAQTAVLQKTRAKLEALEQQINDLQESATSQK